METFGIQENKGMSSGGGQKRTVLNPVGYPPKKIAQVGMAPRLGVLDSKTIYLIDVHFDDSGIFLKQRISRIDRRPFRGARWSLLSLTKGSALSAGDWALQEALVPAPQISQVIIHLFQPSH